MNKMIRRLFALTLVCMLCVSLVVSASATELNLASDLMPIEQENGPEAGYVTGSRISGLPFTMTAKGVTSFLSSMATNKGFVPADYEGSTINVRGTLYHSVSGGKIRAGICYWNASSGVYVPAPNGFQDVTSGQYISVSKAASSLIQGTTYYGYIRNDQGSGSVNSGTITVST